MKSVAQSAFEISVLDEHLDLLSCPVTGKPLKCLENSLVTDCGRRYPIVAGVPILLNPDAPATHGVFKDSLENAELVVQNWNDRQWFHIPDTTIHPFVQAVVAATSGYLYCRAIGRLTRYPIPQIRVPPGENRILIDVGCNWGRWSISAAEAGYQVIGVDPSIEGVLAAREVSRQRGAKASFVVGDARFLPIRSSSVNQVFSYSVLQHLSKENVVTALREIKRVLLPGGRSLIQMPNVFGVRCLWHQWLRKFRQPSGFEVRYWTPSELKKVYTREIGNTKLTVDGYFGLGIQASDTDLFSTFGKCVVWSSEGLRLFSGFVPGLLHAADSLYVESACAGAA